MKILTIIFCLLLSISAFAQQNDTTRKKADTVAQSIVVDGKEYKGDIKSIDPKVIVNVSIVKNSTIIVTKPYATEAYQKKFAAISNNYKRYLEKKQTDTNLQYVLNNTMMNQDRKSTIEVFYQLAPANIKNITFKRDSHFTTDATVIITTKDDN